MSDFIYSALLILVVIGVFNIIIFVHELGHFLAARWRGLQVDRFQIWFGKPIWKKEINGVQYGLGWLPFGGFVALPQMVTMEAVEGANRDAEALPPVSPLDKIIVAFAGPLFSLLLAFLAGFAVWGLGKPQDAIKSNVIGYVVPGGPADQAGLQAGDRILEVEGEPVKWFAGGLFDDIRTRIMLSEGESVTFKIERAGEVLTIDSNFEIRDTKFYQRRALPTVGIGPNTPAIIEEFSGENSEDSPAFRAGLQRGDEVVAVNGVRIYSPAGVGLLLEKNQWKESQISVLRNGKNFDFMVTPVQPESRFYEKPMIGVKWNLKVGFDSELVRVNPFEQIGNSLRTMLLTIETISSPSSHVGVDQLAGPIGIAKTKYLLLKEEYGWLRVLAFFVLFNVNLAVLNMLPLPVLDGGHIVMALAEWGRGKPLPTRFLEVVQSLCALVIIGFMLFITTKDIGDEVPDDRPSPEDLKIVWPRGQSQSE